MEEALYKAQRNRAWKNAIHAEDEWEKQWKEKNMAYEQKDGSGALFKNKDKQPDNNYPDYKGSIKIDGQDYWLSAWIKKSEKGTFMSLAAKPK
jgi:hypothetical protein